MDAATDVSHRHHYDLNGCIHHTGDFQQGHYTASVKTNSTWLHCNDRLVQETTDESLDKNSVYVVLYKKALPALS